MGAHLVRRLIIYGATMLRRSLSKSLSKGLSTGLSTGLSVSILMGLFVSGGLAQPAQSNTTQKRAVSKRAQKRSSSKKRASRDLNQRGVRAIFYADTGVLEMRAGSDVPTRWRIGVWSDHRLILRHNCEQRRCVLTIPPEERKALIKRWANRERDQERPTPAASLKATQSTTALPPPRAALRGVSIFWGDEGPVDPAYPVIIDRVRITHPMITGDQLIATREPIKVRLNYPELVTSVSCVNAECALGKRSVRFFALDPKRARVKVRVQLKPQVKSLRNGRWSRSQAHEFNVRRCVIVAPQLPLLAEVREHRAVIAIARGCGAGDARQLRAKSKPETRVYLSELRPNLNSNWRFFELNLEQIPKKPELRISIFKDQGQAILLGTTSFKITQIGEPSQLHLKVNPLGKVNFIPTNQSAQLEVTFDPLAFQELDGPNNIIPRSIPGYYEVQPLPSLAKGNHQRSSYLIKASRQAIGHVPVMFSYRPNFKPPFTALNDISYELATFPSKARLPLRPVNTPVSLTTDQGDDGVVMLECVGRKRERHHLKRGLVELIPFESRHSCQAIIHRARIPKSAGTQYIQIALNRNSSLRRIPQYKRLIIAKHSATPLVISIPMRDATEFERVEVMIGHDYGSARYDFSPQQDLGAEAIYELVLGDRQWSVSLSTSMPTGLFRYGLTPEDRAAVSLSAGGLARLLWLYSEGRPFPLGVEFGALVTGIDDDPHLSLVGGIGLSVPVLNANTPFEASFNLHAWIEYAPTRVEPGHNPWSFLFGPSFAVGKFSTQF